MANLTQEERDKLSDSDFAVPSKRALPMKDAEHVRLAWDMVDRTEGLTSEERSQARERILRRAHELGVDTSGWTSKMHASADEETTLTASMWAASNVSISELEHPNKMPFKGVLTYFDAPSDRPPGGSKGMKVVIPSSVGVPALTSLVGMAVNYVPDSMDGHDPTEKIGVITAAYNGDPDESGAVPVYIEGYIYAHDFADAAFAIKACQSLLGFSYETAQTRLMASDWNGEQVAMVTQLGYFTGASILLKDSAAYTNTSLAASSDDDSKEVEFSVEQVQQILDALGVMKGELKEYVDEKFASLSASAAQDDDNAAADDNDGADDADANGDDNAAGNDDNDGDENGAGNDSDASITAAAEVVALKSELDVVKAELASLKAEADRQNAQRRSIAHPMTLMAKYDVADQDDATTLIASIDTDEKYAHLSVDERFALKLEILDKKRKAAK